RTNTTIIRPAPSRTTFPYTTLFRSFYCFLRVNAEADPLPIAERLIREHRVAVVPGRAFGVSSGCYFRVAYGALQKATVAEGIGRLVNGLRVLLEKVKS